MDEGSFEDKKHLEKYKIKTYTVEEKEHNNPKKGKYFQTLWVGGHG